MRATGAGWSHGSSLRGSVLDAAPPAPAPALAARDACELDGQAPVAGGARPRARDAGQLPRSEPPLVNGKRGRRRADERAPAAGNDQTRQGHALPYPLYSQSLASGRGDLISFSQSITSQPHRLIFASGNGLHLQILVMVQRLLEERRLQMLTDISNPLHFRWCFLAELILCWVVLVLGWTRLWEYGSY